METNNNTTTRIRIEDMTLGQIQGLKKEIADELNGYLAGLSEMISRRFDVGAIGFSVDYDITEYKTEDDVEIVPATVTHKTRIYFSKGKV